MDINPYESPRPEEPYIEHGIGNADAVVRLLIEIRDAQRDALQLQREGLERLNKTQRLTYVRMVIPLVIILVSFFFVTRITRFAPTPAPPPARAVPASPATFPNGASLIRR